jgi:hypothetical protein
MRKTLALGSAAAMLTGMVVAAAPASADTCLQAGLPTTSCTTATLTVANGGLSILVTAAGAGATSALTSTSASTVDISLGATTVIDSRPLARGWTSKATSTPFTPVTGDAPSIPVSSHSFFVGGVGTPPASGDLAYPDGGAGTEAPVASGADLVTHSSTTAPSLTVVYTPTMRVVVPVSQPGGAYTATVTQSVS